MHFVTILLATVGVALQGTQDASVWSETVQAGQELRGWRPVGNGLVFGYMGPNVWAAALHQITGPHIMLAGVMNNTSAFGPSTVALSVGGENVTFESATMSRIRGTGIVVVDLTAENVAMRVFTYAPFGTKALLRTVSVRNLGDTPIGPIRITASVHRTEVKDGRLFDSFKGSTDGHAMGLTRQLFSGFLEPFEASSTPDRVGVISTEIGTIAPGAEAVRTQYLVFSMAEDDDHEHTLADLRQPASTLMARCADGWRQWLATTVRLDCPDKRLTDLLEETAVSVRVQTADPQKAAGPMEFFAGVWVRDSVGPFKYYLRIGDFETARKMLEFYYRASAYNKVIPNWFPMDIDVARPVDPELDWSAVRTDRVETPSWLIMQHAWYYRFTGDLAPIREHWEYLKRCLMGQLIDEKGVPYTTINYAYIEPIPNTLYRFPHHGDETWIYPGFEVLNSPVFPEPNDHVHWDQYSADSTWEFVVSAEILTEFAKLLGKQSEAEQFRKIARDSRAACERDYWMPERGFYSPAMGMVSLDRHQPPFTAVNLNPLWIGYLRPEEPKAISNLTETIKYTYNPNGLLDATETLKVYVGMLPGMFLYNLAAVHHPLAEKTLSAMVAVASPSGEYTEKHLTEPTGYRTDFLGHRIRPWEGGINADAALYYLTGLDPDVGRDSISLCPRLPGGWKEMSVTNQRVGKGRLGIRVTDDGSARKYVLTWAGGQPPEIAFTTEIPHATILSVRVSGKEVWVAPRNRWDVSTATFAIALGSRPTQIEVRYEPGEVKPVEPVRERYRYVVPDKVPFHDVVLWLQEPRKTSPQDARTYDLLKDKLRTRIITPFMPASPDWLRPFLLRPDGSPNAKVFLMGPRSVTDSLKYAKWWGDPELSRLLSEYMFAGGVVALVKPGETSSEWFGNLLSEARYAVLPSPQTPSVPATGAEGVLASLGLLETKASGMYVFSGLGALAHPSTEPGAATIVGKPIGKGFFLATLADLDAQSLADLASRLTQPHVTSTVRDALVRRAAGSASNAFEDQGRNGTYEDDFSRYPNGSMGLPAWLPISGSWQVQGGEYHELSSNGYDFCSTLNVKLTGDYRVEAVSHLVEGIYETGFVFNSASRYAITQSQMVRFSGPEQVWCGPLQGGFSLKHVLNTDITVRDSTPHTLAIDVYNSRGSYDVWVNGKKIGTDLPLAVRLEEGQTGYVGLLSCRGHVAYSSVSVRPIRR
ncbi:MAG: hypothetical protein HRF45_04380 [Fimbriimonadia bacterium]|jgi:hypothetical protein